jgi:hypothetical protein
MANPACPASFQCAGEWIFVAAQNVHDFLSDPAKIEVHCFFSVLHTKRGPAVCQDSWAARHLRMPDVVGKFLVAIPVNFQNGIGHKIGLHGEVCGSGIVARWTESL